MICYNLDIPSKLSKVNLNEILISTKTMIVNLNITNFVLSVSRQVLSAHSILSHVSHIAVMTD